jgi:hypothetical protein
MPLFLSYVRMLSRLFAAKGRQIFRFTRRTPDIVSAIDRVITYVTLDHMAYREAF